VADQTKRARSTRGGERAGGRSRRPAPAPPPPAPEEARAPICSVTFCPICTMVTALGDARPEVTEHLIVAAREGLLAVRALIDARLEGVEHSSDRGRIQRVEIA
jgi:hypothetical protein